MSRMLTIRPCWLGVKWHFRRFTWHHTCKAKITRFVWSTVVYSLTRLIDMEYSESDVGNTNVPIGESLLDRTNRAIRQGIQPIRVRPCFHKIIFIQVLEFRRIQDRSPVSQRGQVKLAERVRWVTAVEGLFLTSWIISCKVMTVVLFGAALGDEDESSKRSCFTPHPARASQLRIAPGSQPRLYL